MASNNIKYLAWAKGHLLPATTAKPSMIEPTEVMIRLKAVAINPADTVMIDQGIRVASWPLVAGLDGAGVIEATGDKAKDFVVVGDEVLATFAPGDATAPSSVLIFGGSSAVGASVIQLLRLTVPDCMTSSPKHHNHITALGADSALDRNAASLAMDAKSATKQSQGVDAIIDAVGAASTQRHILAAFDPSGPKRYAQVWTGGAGVEVPGGVDSTMFRVSALAQMQGRRNAMSALQALLEEGRYSLPLPVRVVGAGLDELKKGLELMRKGAVSGEKLVAAL